MKLLKKYGSRKYLLRTVLTIALSAVILLLVSGWTIYANSEKTVLRVQEEANAKVLTQVNYNIDYMNEIVRNLAVTLFFDTESVYLLNNRAMDKFNFYQKIMRLEKVVNTSAFLDSILVYNANTDCYYSTRFSMSCTDDGLGGIVDRYLQEHLESVPKLEFIPLRSQAKGTEPDRIDMFSYMMYETHPGEKRFSKLILNVKPEWLFDNIHMINELGKQAESGIFILDRQGRSLQAGRTFPFDLSAIAPKIREQREQTGASFGSFILADSGKKWIASYKDSGTNDWLIVSVQDYEKVFAETHRMRSVSAAILLGFILLSLLASVGAGIVLYRPLNRMIVQMGRTGFADKEQPSQVRDEFSFISDRYHQALEGVRLLKKEQEEKLGSYKTFVLRRLMTDSSSVTVQEWNSAAENETFHIDFAGPMLVVLLQMDQFGRITDRTTPDEKRLYQFAAGNIAGEIISRSFACEVVGMRNDHLGVLLNAGAYDDSAERKLVQLLEEVQRLVMDYYHISITVSISDPIHHLNEVSKQYGRAMELVKYRFVYGKQSIILPAMVQSRKEQVVFDFPPETAKKLEESIKSGDFKMFDAQLNGLTEYIRQLNGDYMMHTLLHLISIVNQSLREINQNSLQPVSVDLKAYYHLMIEKETWDEAKETLRDLFNHILAGRDHSAGQTNTILVDTIKDIIDDRSADPNLSLQMIASMLKMSTAHISKLFREKEHMPISEYVTEVRLNRARLLLETSDYTVNEIMDRVGFSNQSYFFRLFKKKFGTTPKEYRTKKMVV